MILNLTDISEEEIKERAEVFGRELEDGTCPVVTNQSDYYSNQLYKEHENMTTLRMQENRIVQNDRERTNEVGECCFNTALNGAKTFQKSRRK